MTTGSTPTAEQQAQQIREVWLLPVFTPRPDCAAELSAALRELQQESRQDQGSIEYSVYAVDGRFILIEGWDSQTDLERHNEQAHVQEFVALSARLLAKPFTVTPITRVG
ncbi:antibiotic biosynthesis monooxygenase [Sinomonas sp. ASV486]|uniref:Quinol monooxygenase n=1 Tax=Sinomonas puerhi TaxID=3238584 RepID=A0AB39L4V4_9MICC|nr:antibiotic biosynthesis monooxygenase [Sinomonas sp. ASV486]MDQ4491228.1 antibiotic biosynthesis monooxygenase [Sinomonas sp. ASV486]